MLKQLKPCRRCTLEKMCEWTFMGMTLNWFCHECLVNDLNIRKYLHE